MDYNAFIERTANKETEEVRTARLATYRTDTKRKKESVISVELLEKYEEIKEKCKSFGDIWTKEEISVVESNFKSKIIVENDKIKYIDKSMIFKTAIELERTTKAIWWKCVEIFTDNEKIHRGNAVKEFRELINS